MGLLCCFQRGVSTSHISANHDIRPFCLSRRVDERERAHDTPWVRGVRRAGANLQRVVHAVLVHHPDGRWRQDGGVCRVVFVRVDADPGSGEPSACVGGSRRSPGNPFRTEAHIHTRLVRRR